MISCWVFLWNAIIYEYIMSDQFNMQKAPYMKWKLKILYHFGSILVCTRMCVCANKQFNSQSPRYAWQLLDTVLGLLKLTSPQPRRLTGLECRARSALRFKPRWSSFSFTSISLQSLFLLVTFFLRPWEEAKWVLFRYTFFHPWYTTIRPLWLLCTTAYSMLYPLRLSEL